MQKIYTVEQPKIHLSEVIGYGPENKIYIISNDIFFGNKEELIRFLARAHKQVVNWNNQTLTSGYLRKRLMLRSCLFQKILAILNGITVLWLQLRTARAEPSISVIHGAEIQDISIEHVLLMVWKLRKNIRNLSKPRIRNSKVYGLMKTLEDTTPPAGKITPEAGIAISGRQERAEGLKK